MIELNYCAGSWIETPTNQTRPSTEIPSFEMSKSKPGKPYCIFGTDLELKKQVMEKHICCAPTKLLPLTVLFADSEGKFK